MANEEGFRIYQEIDIQKGNPPDVVKSSRAANGDLSVKRQYRQRKEDYRDIIRKGMSPITSKKENTPTAVHVIIGGGDVSSPALHEGRAERMPRRAERGTPWKW